MKRDRIRILLADDHAVLRAGLRALLSREPDMEVVGEAASGSEALRKVEELQPDIVLMDITMPGMEGLEATAQISILETEIVVQFQKRAHNPLLLAAGFHKKDIPIPWLGRKHLRFLFG